MDPPFESFCPSRHTSPATPPIPPSYQWAVTPGPVGKPGFVQLCGGRNHSGGALITLADAFAGPSLTAQHGFIYNTSHAITMNPWYAQRYTVQIKAVPYDRTRHMHCYDEVVWAHSIFDDTVGPHTLLEVAPILSHLLDATPAHVPILLTLTPSLRAAYHSLGLDSERFVAVDLAAVYHAKRMYWFRRPEEYTATYWQSLRRRIHPQPLQPLPPASPTYRPLLVYLHRTMGSRSVANVDELLSAVRAAFPESAYEVAVFNGSLSLTQSMQLFSRASLVVGPHGGAFLNSLFLPPLSAVVEIAYPSHADDMPFPPYYYLMSCGLRLFHHIAMADTGGYSVAMTVNVDSVLERMHAALDMRDREVAQAGSAGSIGQLLMEGRMAVDEAGSLDAVM